MSNDFSDYEVKEENISDEDWESFLSAMQKNKGFVVNENSDKRTKQDPIPVNLSDYLNKLQFASIRKLQNFGWELFFIRRSDPTDIKTVMYYPSSGATALIENDGTVNRSHDVIVRETKLKPEPQNASDKPKNLKQNKIQVEAHIESNGEGTISLDKISTKDDGTYETHGVIFETRDEAEAFFTNIQRLREEKE